MKYRNKTDQRQDIPGVGSVKAHGIIEVDAILENPNLELVKEEPDSIIASNPSHPTQGIAMHRPSAPVEGDKK